MKFVATSTLTPPQREAIRQLWNTEYPESLSHPTQTHFENYLATLEVPFHILLVNEQAIVEGWYCDFMRKGEKWFAMIIAAGLQGKGWGSQLLNRAKEKEPALNGWVIEHNSYKKHDGQCYKSPRIFYQKNGFQIVPEHRSEFGALSVVQMKWTKHPVTKA